MLDSPDLFNLLDNIAKQQTLNDIANGNLINFEEMDPAKIEKEHKRNSLKIIKDFIKGCKLNGNYKELEDELKAYTKEYINKKYPFQSLPTIMNILRSNQMSVCVNILNPPLQAYILYVELNKLVYFYIQEEYIRKNDKEDIKFIHAFICHSLELLNGINILLLGDNNNSVITVYRTFYENYIVFAYLQKHPELKDRFFDHIILNQCENQLEYHNLCKTKAPEEIQKTYDNLINKYKEDNFKENYGWANPLIKGNKKLKKMYEDSELDESFDYYYSLSNKYIHSTGLSLSVKPELKDIIGFLYSITDIMTKEFQELFKYLQIQNTKERHLLIHWINEAAYDLSDRIYVWLNN